ncbi:MAG: hypothetical protein ACR2K2_08550 [Mycobacteriales bacterium]
MPTATGTQWTSPAGQLIMVGPAEVLQAVARSMTCPVPVVQT